MSGSTAAGQIASGPGRRQTASATGTARASAISAGVQPTSRSTPSATAPCTAATSRSGVSRRRRITDSTSPRTSAPRSSAPSSAAVASSPYRARRRARSAWNSANCVPGHLGEHVQHAQVDRPGAEQADVGVHEGPEAGGGRLGACREGVGQLERRPDRAEQQLQQDRVLAGEVVVDRRLAHARRVGDRAGAGRREADRAEQGARPRRARRDGCRAHRLGRRSRAVDRVCVPWRADATTAPEPLPCPQRPHIRSPGRSILRTQRVGPPLRPHIRSPGRSNLRTSALARGGARRSADARGRRNRRFTWR